MQGTLERDRVVVERTDQAVTACKRSGYGSVLKTRITLSLYEAAFLVGKNWLAVTRGRKTLSEDDIVRAGARRERSFATKYAVYSDLRTRGYVVKTALKFGADFRVYEKGVRPGDDHAKWIVYPVRESERLTWYDFSAKNRVAHSTKKRLLVAVVDDEDDVTYFEVGWTRP